MLIYRNAERVDGQSKYGNPWSINCRTEQISSVAYLNLVGWNFVWG